MHKYVKHNIIVHFIILSFKNWKENYFPQKIQTEKAEEPLILTEQEKTKPDTGGPRLARFENSAK